MPPEGAGEPRRQPVKRGCGEGFAHPDGTLADHRITPRDDRSHVQFASGRIPFSSRIHLHEVQRKG